MNVLQIPQTHLKRFGDRDFSAYAIFKDSTFFVFLFVLLHFDYQDDSIYHCIFS